jgi:ABC-type uncharacterized transport system substrate-binding protein
MLPGLKRLAVLFDPGFPPDKTQMKNLDQVARSTGITLVLRPVEDANAAMAALEALGPDDADAIFVLKEATLRHAGPGLTRAAWKQKLPILVTDPDLAVTFRAAMAAVGTRPWDLGRTCGRMTARILKVPSQRISRSSTPTSSCYSISRRLNVSASPSRALHLKEIS